MKPSVKQLPFTLNRNLRIPLATQLAENLRNAILSGYYKTGDILPCYKQLARELNVSLRVPREAMADLVARNMVNPRPRIGCEVMPLNARSWKGRIHVIAPGDTFITYFAAMLFERFRKVMTKEGWLVDLITFSRTEHGKTDFSMLDEALSRACDFALAIFPTAGTIRHLEKHNIRHICFGTDAGISFKDGMHNVIRYIQQKKLRKIALVEYKAYDEIHQCLRDADIEFKSIAVPWMTGFGYLERISRKGYELTKKLITSNSREFPDLIFFTDDFVARGGLGAILEAGLKIPEDVKVITFSNKGLAPFFPGKLIRIEANPLDLADKIADEVLRRMSGLPPQNVKTSVLYIPEN